MELIKVKIKRVIGPTPSGAAILIGNEYKTFVVFVGFYEAAALIREMNNETPARPLTHELIQNVFLGFDIEVKKIIISSIIENTFCATLILRQAGPLVGDQTETTRKEVRIDARPSDCLVLALKNSIDLYVAEDVFNQVQDVTKMTAEVEGNLMGMPLGSIDFEATGQETAEESRSIGEDDDPLSVEDDEYVDDDPDVEEDDDDVF